MSPQSPSEIANRAVHFFGPETQQMIALEEMGELTVALMHLRRGRGDVRSVVEEIGDVCLAMESLKHIFGYEDVEKLILEKTTRLERRVNALIAKTVDEHTVSKE